MKDEMSFEKKGKYLLITGKGERNSLAEVMDGTNYIIKQVKANSCEFVLIDYREIEYSVHFSDAFNIIKLYDNQIPEFKSLVIAAVLNRNNLEIGDFWKKLGKKRNYRFKIFEEFDLAEQWLLKQVKKHNHPLNN